MATVKAETFDAEMFGKLVALFDSNQAGEAESAFRKAVLMCAKNGLHFSEAAGMAFGRDGGEADELRDQLEKERSEHVADVEAAAEKVRELNDQVAALQKAAMDADAGGGDDEHVIDLRGRLRRAWRHWQFRLFVLALVQEAGAVFLLNGAGVAAPLFGLLNWLLFAVWSVALFRKRGLGQMLLKWLIYFVVAAAGAAVAFNMAGGGIPAPAPAQAVLGGSLLAALLLTLSKLSDWMGAWIREHIWESEPVHVVRAWF
jgi:hypothetical protein